jgi:hypothetical protein
MIVKVSGRLLGPLHDRVGAEGLQAEEDLQMHGQQVRVLMHNACAQHAPQEHVQASLALLGDVLRQAERKREHRNEGV